MDNLTLERAFMHNYFPELEHVSIEFVYFKHPFGGVAEAMSREDLKWSFCGAIGITFFLAFLGAGILALGGIRLDSLIIVGLSLSSELVFLGMEFSQFKYLFSTRSKWIVFLWTALQNIEPSVRDFVLAHEFAHIVAGHHGDGVETYVDQIAAQRLGLSASDVKEVRRAITNLKAANAMTTKVQVYVSRMRR